MGLRFICSFVFQRATEHENCDIHRYPLLQSLRVISTLYLLTGRVVVSLDNILHQSKQSLANFQVLALCPIYLTLESHLISKQALHICVIHILAFSSAPRTIPPSFSVIQQTHTPFLGSRINIP